MALQVEVISPTPQSNGVKFTELVFLKPLRKYAAKGMGSETGRQLFCLVEPVCSGGYPQLGIIVRGGLTYGLEVQDLRLLWLIGKVLAIVRKSFLTRGVLFVSGKWA